MDYNETNATLDQVASEGNFADIVFSEFFLEGVATPILGIFGFFGNVLSIKVSNVIIVPQNIDQSIFFMPSSFISFSNHILLFVRCCLQESWI